MSLYVQITCGQQIGHPHDVHPKLTTHFCKAGNGCSRQDTSVVLDSGWRNIYDIHTGDSCLTPSLELNKTICSTAEECGKQCALSGNNYVDTGVEANGDSVTLQMYRKWHGSLIEVSPQIYLLNGKDYQLLKLLNQEISFDVDVSKAPCGMDAAMYLTGMDATGGRSDINPAGAAYGTGYCDSQCYTSYAFINGEANVHHKGACCNEMDLWEANARSTQTTMHPCNVTGLYACSGEECGVHEGAVCDRVGCGFNPYGLGDHDFYGLDGIVNTTKPFKVVTQFLTDDNTDTGTLTEIRRLYIQNGVTIPNAQIHLSDSKFNSITKPYCDAFLGFNPQKSFKNHNGLAQMGEALGHGMVLVMGIWNDPADYMNWLDAGSNGPCSKKEGKPSLIKAKDPSVSVTFSDIRWGDIGSTC